MRAPALLIAGLLLVAAATLSPVRAQVTLDLHALDQGGNKPAQPKSPPAATRSRQRHHAPPPKQAAQPSPESPTQAPAQSASPTAAPTPPPPSIPAAPPAALSLPTIVVPAPTGKSAPPPVPVSTSAGGAVTPTSNGVRVTFTPDRADLNPASVASIKTYIDGVPKSDDTTYNVVGYAAGPQSDPSTPRRLSLSRALAVRGVLMEEGVRSEHIYVRALGPAKAGGPSDRVDVTALGINNAEPPK